MTNPIPLVTPSEHFSTDEEWMINSVGLSQYGWAVKDVGGARYDLPTHRGSNIKIPFRPGTLHKKGKMPEERPIELQMWLTGTEPGTGEINSSIKLQWNDSWDFLRRTVWQYDGQQVVLTKRWWQTVDGVATLLEAEALAEINDPMRPSMTGRGRADFQVTLLLSDPFFYGPWQTVTIPLDTDVAIYNPGHDAIMYNNLFVEFHGQLQRPMLTNSTPDLPIKLKQDSNVYSNPIIFDIGNWLATVDATGENVIKYTKHSGAKHWFGLVPKGNLVRLTAVWGTINDPTSPKESPIYRISSDEGSTTPTGSGFNNTGFATIRYRVPYI